MSPIPAGDPGYAHYIRRVVSTNVDLDHINDLGWTVLLETVILGGGSKPYLDIVATLIRAGVDISIADNNGRTAPDHPRIKDYTEIARIIERS